MNAPATFRPLRDVALDLANHAETIAEDRRPTRLAASTFKVWRVTSGLAQPHPVHGETLADVERELAIEACRGDTFNILETPAIEGTAQLHTCIIRRGSQATWADGRKVYSYKADRICSVAVASFEPVQPWRWTPGCDVVGRSNVIEARP